MRKQPSSAPVITGEQELPRRGVLRFGAMPAITAQGSNRCSPQ